MAYREMGLDHPVILQCHSSQPVTLSGINQQPAGSLKLLHVGWTGLLKVMQTLKAPCSRLAYRSPRDLDLISPAALFLTCVFSSAVQIEGSEGKRKRSSDQHHGWLHLQCVRSGHIWVPKVVSEDQEGLHLCNIYACRWVCWCFTYTGFTWTKQKQAWCLQSFMSDL